MEPSGRYLMWNRSGNASSGGQDEGKFHNTISLVEKPSICLTDTDSGGSGFTATPGERSQVRRIHGQNDDATAVFQFWYQSGVTSRRFESLKTERFCCCSSFTMLKTLTQLVELEVDGRGHGAQAVGLGDSQHVERLPECRVVDVALLADGVHDARLVIPFTTVTTR